MFRTCLAATALLIACAVPAHAETLLVDRVHHEKMGMPHRGMRMGEVQRHYGAPMSRLEPRGGQKHQWPVINRWMYPAFTVYFEHGKVIDAVANKATPSEIGPKPPIR